MDSDTIGFMPATEWAEKIRTKQMSPVEAMRAWLDLITTLNPKVNEVAYQEADQAMDAAHAAEKALMGGERIGRLHGVPVTIKDLAWTKDMPTQHGSLTSKGFRSAEDTPVVPRLKSEG